MNYLDREILEKANEEAIYNLYLYLAHKALPDENGSLQAITEKLEKASRNNAYDWDNKDLRRLNLLKNALTSNPALAHSKIGSLTYSKDGLTACIFTKPDGAISVVFKGTGDGEWIDNGEGLSGIPEENVYTSFSHFGNVTKSISVKKDYATDQQVEALNWFNKVASKEKWNTDTKITVSGHSKGGNKAQFVTMHSDLIDDCYSFAGQGFSPEALHSFQNRYKEEFEKRRNRIYSFSSDNDYVNVLGSRLTPQNHIFYVDSGLGLHNMEAMLDKHGRLRKQCNQGRISSYAEKLSKDLMKLNPSVRQYATLGIMNIFQKYVGDGIPVNGDSVSTEKTLIGIAVAVRSFVRNLGKLN